MNIKEIIQEEIGNLLNENDNKCYISINERYGNIRAIIPKIKRWNSTGFPSSCYCDTLYVTLNNNDIKELNVIKSNLTDKALLIKNFKEINPKIFEIIYTKSQETLSSITNHIETNLYNGISSMTGRVKSKYKPKSNETERYIIRGGNRDNNSYYQIEEYHNDFPRFRSMWELKSTLIIGKKFGNYNLEYEINKSYSNKGYSNPASKMNIFVDPKEVFKIKKMLLMLNRIISTNINSVK